MSYIKLKFKPGVYKDDTPLEAKGYWVDVDKIRFVRGLPETIYGWERASTTLLLGTCRGAFTWGDNSRNPFAAFGTDRRLYAMDNDGNITNLTPIITRAYAQSMTFATDGSTSTVTLTYNAHGLIANQEFTLANSTVDPVGGITVAGSYSVATVVDANNITFVAAQTSTSLASTAITVDYTVYLAPGLKDGIGGAGYGTGAYGSGTYGGSSTGAFYARSWALSNWGQNLIANPRGGGIYEWAPNASATELVTNGSFTGSATGWSLGSGWAYGANAVSATNASSDLSQSITLPISAWCRINGNVTAYTSGAAQVKVGGTAIGANIGAAGKFTRAVYTGDGGAQTLAMTGLSATLTVDDISVQVETYGELLPGAPVQVTCAFVDGVHRQVIACGVPNDLSGSSSGAYDGAFNPLRIGWTGTQNNQTWVSAGTNLAGQALVSNGSRIVRGLPGTRENVILTDTTLYGMRFNPDPSIVYDIYEIASQCGLIGPNAVCNLGGVFYWMDPTGGFWMYAGSYPQPLLCTLNRDMNDNLAWVQQDKVYAFPVTTSGRQEVWWLYPDSRDGIECSRYVAYSITESLTQGEPVWMNGTFDRSAWTNSGSFQFPLAVDSSGQIWFQEKGFTQDGGARSWSATTSYFDLADDGTQIRVKNIQPDTESQQGNYTVTINTNIRNGSGILSRSAGPYSIMTSTGKVNTRISGEEGQFKFAGNSAPAFWRLGAFRYEVETSGRTR